LATIVNPRTGTITRLDGQMITPRTQHTATLMPDGTVLIVGGRGSVGQLAETAELFDPQTNAFTALGVEGISSRVDHTATLLTDGRVLIAGGRTTGALVVQDIEIWDVHAQRVVSAGRLAHPRAGQTATLLADGRVAFSDGTGEDGEPVRQPEVFDPTSGRGADFLPVGDDRMPTRVAASSPADGATDVPVGSRITLRFSRPMSPSTISPGTVALIGDEGLVESLIVSAEHGRLAFVTPRTSLGQNVSYRLTIVGASDERGVAFAAPPITFTTAKDPVSVRDLSDSETWVPDDDHRRNGWRSDRMPSPWESLAPLMGASGVTAISGRVLMLDGRPLRNVSSKVVPRSKVIEPADSSLNSSLERRRGRCSKSMAPQRARRIAVTDSSSTA
jgi:hypothetical protein